MLNYILNPINGQATIILRESLTIMNASELKDVLVNTLAENTQVIINHNEAEEFDLTYIQILISAYRSAKLANKTFLMDLSEQNIPFMDLINQLGILGSVPEINELLNLKLKEDIIG